MTFTTIATIWMIVIPITATTTTPRATKRTTVETKTLKKKDYKEKEKQHVEEWFHDPTDLPFTTQTL